MNCSLPGFPVLHYLPEFAIVLGSLLFHLLQGTVSGDSKKQEILTTGRNASKTCLFCASCHFFSARTQSSPKYLLCAGLVLRPKVGSQGSLSDGLKDFIVK